MFLYGNAIGFHGVRMGSIDLYPSESSSLILLLIGGNTVWLFALTGSACYFISVKVNLSTSIKTELTPAQKYQAFLAETNHHRTASLHA